MATTPTPFPYVPGLLSFRELPPILEALDQLSAPPEIILVDGHGRAHPRRFGIACHLGLWLRIPTIGVGKTRLCGEYEEPGLTKGSASPLRDGSETLGVVLRTRTRVRPVFVSVGYGLPLEACVNWTLAVTPRYRIPEPVRKPTTWRPGRPGTGRVRSLRGRNDRSEKVGNRGQIFSFWRCIVVLFAEKSGKYGPILPLSQ